MHLLWKVPWALPMVMFVWNVLFVIWTFLLEGRLKMTPLRFAVLYYGTIRPALQGDLEPFVMVLSMPEWK